MSPTIMDGKKVAAEIKEQVRKEVSQLNRAPLLIVILVGNNNASEVYVRNKEVDCKECGILCSTYRLPYETTENELLSFIKRFNNGHANGILVQLPLPSHINEETILNAIAPRKDVDCFHPANVGKMVMGNPTFLPCTPCGILELLDAYDISVSGKECVVIGRSNIVGKPMALLLTQRGGTVTVCHTGTKDLADHTRKADIIVSAAGKTGLITADMVKDGAVVIDVAMNRNENGKLCGDVDFDEVAPKCSFITPVPGGVGPMTRAMLMKNTLLASKN